MLRINVVDEVQERKMTSNTRLKHVLVVVIVGLIDYIKLNVIFIIIQNAFAEFIKRNGSRPLIGSLLVLFNMRNHGEMRLIISHTKRMVVVQRLTWLHAWSHWI